VDMAPQIRICPAGISAVMHSRLKIVMQNRQGPEIPGADLLTRH
jgi:hypothetical protein